MLGTELMLWRIRYTIRGCFAFWGGWRMLQCWWAWSAEDHGDATPAEAVAEDMRGLVDGEMP